MVLYAAKSKYMALASACHLARAFLVYQNMVAALHGETQQYPSLHLASSCKLTNTTMGVSYTHLNLITHPRASEPTPTDIRNRDSVLNKEAWEGQIQIMILTQLRIHPNIQWMLSGLPSRKEPTCLCPWEALLLSSHLNTVGLLSASG